MIKNHTVWNKTFFRHVRLLNRYYDLIKFLDDNGCNVFSSNAYIKTPGYRADKPKIVEEKIKNAHDPNKINVVYYINDHSEVLDVPHNTALLRVSLKKSQLMPNEICMPFLTDDFAFVPVEKSVKPKVSFCGICYMGSDRTAWINTLKDDHRIQSSIILRPPTRSNYACNDLFTLPSGETIKLQEEFLQNLSESEFAFCPVGLGNYSIRFFEALSMGRIPCVIETDIVLPFEDMINWKDIAIISKDAKSMCDDIVQFWSTRNIKEAQQACKDTHTKYFVDNLNELLLDRIKTIHELKESDVPKPKRLGQQNIQNIQIHQKQALKVHIAQKQDEPSGISRFISRPEIQLRTQNMQNQNTRHKKMQACCHMLSKPQNKI